LEIPTSDRVIVGMDSPDDAGVYQISADLALIQTVDFFTPIVDNPYQFGQIAAANALSDIYAMGGVPKTAMNLVGFPLKQMDISILQQVIQGGLNKLKEADVALVGGHSVEDRELKYGMSVTGFIHPDRILTKKNIQAGDCLVLTKPLGTGVINTAIKGGVAPPDVTERVTQQMAALNRDAAEVMNQFSVHACTDITGFGLLGHLAEMVVGSGCSLRLSADTIPILPGAIEYAAMGLLPAGAFKNREFRESMVEFSSSVNQLLRDLLFDPQTSGGLLICLDRADAKQLIGELHDKDIDEAAIIGDVLPAAPEKIRVQ
jgi:selenide,water dikinase